MSPEGESEVQDKGESEVQRKGESEGRRKGLGTSKGEDIDIDRDRDIDRGRSRERDIDKERDRYRDRGTAAPQLTAPHSSFLAALSSALREELNADAGVGDGSARCDSDNNSGGGRGSGRGSTATPTASGRGDLGPSIPDPVLVPLWVMSASSLSDGCAVLSQALHASLSTPMPIPMGSAAERARDPSSLSLPLPLPLSKPSTLSALPLPLPLSTVTSIRVFDRPCPSFPPSLPFGVCIRRVTYDVCEAEEVVSKGRERETVYGTEILNAASDAYGRVGDRDSGKNSDDSAVLGVEESNVVWLNPCTSTLSSSFPISISPQIERERNSSNGRGRDGDTFSIILSVLPSTSITTSTTTCAKEGEQEPITGQTLDREILSAAVHWPSPVQPHTNATAATTATARPAFNGDGDASTASVTADCSEDGCEDEDEDGDGDGDDVGGMTTAASVSLGEKIGTCSLSTSSSFPCAVPPSSSHSTLWEICIVQREEPEPDLELEWTLDLYTDMDPLDGETVNKEREKEREKNGKKVEEGASEEDCTMRERERMRMRMRVLCSLPFDPHTASASASGPSACMLTVHVGGGEGGSGLFGVTMSLLQQSNISSNNSTVHTDGGVGAGSARCEGEGEGDRDRGRLFLCGSLRVEDTEESDGEGKWRKGGNNRSKGGALFLCVRLALKGIMYLAIAYELAAGFALLAGMRRVENMIGIDGGMERGVERGLDGTPGVRDRTKDCLPFPLPILSPLSSFLLSSRVSTHTASNSSCKGDSKTESEAESAGKGKGPCDILDLVRSVTVSSSSSTRSLLPLDPTEKEGGGNRETGSEVGAGTGRALSLPAGGGTGGGTVGGVCVPLSNESPRRWALIPMPMLAAAINTLTRLDEGVKERMRVMGEVVKERMRAVLTLLFRAAEGFKLGL